MRPSRAIRYGLTAVLCVALLVVAKPSHGQDGRGSKVRVLPGAPSAISLAQEFNVILRLTGHA